MSDDLVVYKCVVCGKAYTKRQSFSAHMKVHRDVGFTQFNVRIPELKVEAFKALCRKHNTTTCHLIMTLMDAAVEGDKSGLVQIGSPNPVVINVMSFFGGVPRGRRKYSYALLAGDGLVQAVNCGFLDHRDWWPGRLGWCRKRKLWVSDVVCGPCKTKALPGGVRER